MYMSKQLAMAEWAPQPWLFMAKGFYLQMLRDAVIILGLNEAKKKDTPAPKSTVSQGLFRFGRSTIALSHPASMPPAAIAEAQTHTLAFPSPQQPATQATPPETAAEHDILTDEVERWLRMEQYRIDDFIDDDGVVNEMEMIYSMRSAFPLHYCVFKQVCSHICHEGNTEQLFSLSGALSDDNGKMSPDNLATWTAIGANIKIYKPGVEAIMNRYMKKFSKAGKASAEAELLEAGLAN